MNDEYRLTYNTLLGEGLEREPLGLCTEKHAREMAEARRRGGRTDVRIWKRPKPAKWEQVQ